MVSLEIFLQTVPSHVPATGVSSQYDQSTVPCWLASSGGREENLWSSSVFGQSNFGASKPVPATSLVIDLRNFTPNLKASTLGDDGVDQFCSFLAEFHAICIDAALMAMEPSQREEAPVHMTSTGDGMIIVFFDQQKHFMHGYLAALLLHKKLEEVCLSYNRKIEENRVPNIWFGIGVESGHVSPVEAGYKTSFSGPSIHTVLGNCINVASRAQGVTKQLAGSRTILAGTTVEQLTHHLLDTDFKLLIEKTSGIESDFAVKTELEQKMTELNHEMCLKFLHLHNLKGVDKPIPLYRVSESALTLENETFQTLLDKLTADEAHTKAVKEVFVD